MGLAIDMGDGLIAPIVGKDSLNLVAYFGSLASRDFRNQHDFLFIVRQPATMQIV